MLLCLSFLCSAIYFFNLPKRPYKYDFIFKGLSVFILAIVAITSLSNTTGMLLFISFLFASVGDVSLTFKGEKPFLIGLVSFLLAHIFTSILFLHLMHFPAQINLLQKGLILLFIVFAFVMWNSLKPTLGSLKIPVICYMFFLISMGITGVLAKGNNAYIVSGVCLFIASDSMLAWQKFKFGNKVLKKKNIGWWFDYFIWATYYLAQVFVLFGVVGSR